MSRSIAPARPEPSPDQPPPMPPAPGDNDPFSESEAAAAETEPATSPLAVRVLTGDWKEIKVFLASLPKDCSEAV